MIILKSRSYMTKEDLVEASEAYGKQLKNGVLILDERMDLVHISEMPCKIDTVNIVTGENGTINNGMNEEDLLCEEDPEE